MLQATVAPSPPLLATPIGPSEAGGIPEPPVRDPYDLARRLRPDDYAAYEARGSLAAAPVKQGDRRDFWVIRDDGGVLVHATARRVSANAYWFFDDEAQVSESDLDAAVTRFESDIWPGVTSLFGDIANPGIDGDSHLVILHTALRRGTGGYFSGADAFPSEIHKFSNEREIIYMATVLRVGEESYVSVLAHELQHAVHFAQDAGEEAWMNEGLSELATVKIGLATRSYTNYLTRPDTQLNSWPNDSDTGASYGGSLLFHEYLIDQYGGNAAVAELIATRGDGFGSIDSWLDAIGADATALEVFSDWAVATLIDEETGRYSYPNRDVNGVSRQTIFEPRSRSKSVSQFGVDYWALELDHYPVDVHFQGDSKARIIPVSAHSGDSCWWGNSGDSIDTKLTRSFDLAGVSAATLRFRSWYDIEEDWDYAYIEISPDSGESWTLLTSDHTTDRNPNGTGYGPGLTGGSQNWVSHEIDLTPYTGAEVLIRFEYVTDDAVNANGICFDDIEIPETGFVDDAESDRGWDAEGFVRLTPSVPQPWILQLVRRPKNGPADVSQISVSDDGEAEIAILPPADEEQIFLVISAAHPVSITAADYTLVIEAR